MLYCFAHGNVSYVECQLPFSSLTVFCYEVHHYWRQEAV